MKTAPRINRLLIEWLPGDVHSLRWFSERNVSQNLAYQYAKRGTLQRIGHGIYQRTGEKVNWLGGVRLLQEELQKAFYVSGRTALELEGHAHYAPLGKAPVVFLTTYEKHRLPVWFKKANFGCDFHIVDSKLFADKFFAKNKSKILDEYTSETGFKIKISCRELAIMELLNILDLSHSFETAENYMSGLVGMRKSVLQPLLENCRSVKVKRLFLYLAERIGHSYIEQIDVTKIDLGKGKRQLVKVNAKLDKKYQITVPKGYEGDLL